MSSQVLIRQFVKEDFPAILAIERRGQITPWSEQMLRDSIAANHQVWVLSLNNITIGFIVFYLIAGECHILNFCIDSQYRGQGFGKQLLQYVLQHAKKLHADMALLEVRASNCIALNLYRHLGFNEISIRKKYYLLPQNKGREDAIVLALELA